MTKTTDAMTYRGYTAGMSFDPHDRIIVGRVLGLDDIVTFHAESVAEFEANFHAVVDDYLAACEALGAAAEKPASGKLMLRVAPAVHAAALKAAARSGVSLNKWAEQALGAASRSSGDVPGDAPPEAGPAVGRSRSRRSPAMRTA